MLDFPESRINRPALMTRYRAARVAKLTRKQLENMIAADHVQTMRSGRRVYVVTASLEALVEMLNHGAA